MSVNAEQLNDNKATIKEAASQAGVSVASVSRALNGKPGLSDETRRRILAICEQLKYKPSAAARQMVSGRDATVGLLLGEHDLALTPYFAQMHTHLIHELNTRGLMQEVVSYQDTARASELVSAAIVMELSENDPRIEMLKQQKVPFVCLGMQHTGSWVAPDDFNGVFQITQMLLKEGRNNLLFVSDTTDAMVNLRLQGFRCALQNAQLPEQPEQIVKIPNTRTPVLAAYRHLMLTPSLLDGVDGIVCLTDEIAIGVRQALEDLNFDVPGDIAVTGFDDMPILAESLTTVRQDLRAIAQQVVNLLDEARRGLSPRGVVLPVEIIRRQSA